MNPVSKDSIKCAWTTAKFLSLKEVKVETYYLTRKKKKVEEEKKNSTKYKNNKLLTNHNKIQNNN